MFAGVHQRANRGGLSEGTWYQNVTPENAERIIQEHLIGGKVVDDLCFARNALPPVESGPR